MRRKVVRHGVSTLTISLPARWAKQHRIKPGKELEVTARGGILEVAASPSDDPISLDVDIKDHLKVGVRYINAAYRKGVDELTLHYGQSSYLHRIERCLAEEVLGFEIVRQGENWCTMKVIPGEEDGSFETLLRRVWILLLSMGDDTLKGMKEKSNNFDRGIVAIDNRISKFTNYCIRVLARRGSVEHRNIPAFYRLLRGLEELADPYKYLAERYCHNLPKLNPKFFSIMENINKDVRRFYGTFYKPDNHALSLLLSDVKRSRQQFFDVYFKEKIDPMYLQFLLLINEKLMELLSAVVELSIIKN
ncbi:hypothetical protein J4460_08380 [Candidatus Woesearchaeota archaeon]|nr:MAG: hypothetical protein QS99_C0012G0024 [archaeon GW2011_AR4]MBS3130654.1 hypothetical protein [Candidatus Woesearchaeota archaeon]HIH37951.1 hypothetical protein [Candidatus Woesearchaeota archaeon]HIH48644.1 hypothetical protein [Candidatus Woesearchaeota archaeon]HIJ03730.1 hypothetical protein [Candidatus Woesearchaeota archaeon]